jgi:uncharacterized protein (DUF58 family)
MSVPTSETRRFSASPPRTRWTKLREEITRVTHLTPTGLIMSATAVLFWCLGRFVAGTPLYLIAYGLALVVIVSLLAGRRPLPLEGSRADSRARLAEGETVNMEVSLTATRRLSTFILEEKLPEGLGDPARVPVATLESGENVEHNYKLTCKRRGVYQLGPLVAKWRDPFGLTENEVVLAEPFELLVHPSREIVSDRPLTRMFEDPPIRPPVSKPWPFGMEFYGMREYKPGDDVRKVVWRAYARTGQLLVREAEQGITDKITIVLDQNRRTHSSGEVSESLEAGVKAAASLALRHLREGYSVTLEGCSRKLIGPVRGAPSAMRLLDELARVERERETLTEPIMRMLNTPGRDNHIVIITPHLDAESSARLAFLTQRGASVLVAALMWDDLASETLAVAASLGCQVVEIRPGAPLAASFRREVGAGR